MVEAAEIIPLVFMIVNLNASGTALLTLFVIVFEQFQNDLVISGLITPKQSFFR